ncbi:MAG: hypothetical protein RR284_02730, partial [Ruthenibacterium sp.]
MAEPLPYKGGERSVPFCGKGETPPHGVSFCKAKAMPYRGVFEWRVHSVLPFPARKKVVATGSRREGACNRTGEPSVPFCGKGETPPHGVSFC